MVNLLGLSLSRKGGDRLIDHLDMTTVIEGTLNNIQTNKQNNLLSSHFVKPEDHWSCIAHLSAEDMLKSAVTEEKKFKHCPWAGADNPLGPQF